LNGIVAIQSTPLTTRGGRVLGVISTHWCRPHTPGQRKLHLLDALARQAADVLDRRDWRSLLDSEKRLGAQAEAFRAAIGGAPLDVSLGILARAVMAEVPEARTAFYVSELDVTRLHPIRGADGPPESYGQSWSFPVETPEGKSIGVFSMN